MKGKMYIGFKGKTHIRYKLKTSVLKTAANSFLLRLFSFLLENCLGMKKIFTGLHGEE